MQPVLLTLVPFVVYLALRHVLKERAQLSLGLTASLIIFGALGGFGCWWLEEWFWMLTGVDLMVKGGNASTSIIALIVFATPLEEGAKVLLLWPSYRLGKLKNTAEALLGVTLLAASFAIAEAYYLAQGELDYIPLRLMLGQWAQLFFAGCWGYVLGTRQRLHWLRPVWLAVVLLHGLFDHVVYYRGIGTLSVVVPALLATLAIAAVVIRRIRRAELASGQAPSMGSVFDAPSASALADLLKRKEQPLLVHWVVLGGFVTTGVVLAALVAAVFLGHRLGIDFAAADESEFRSNGPLVLLGVAIMSAFPVSAYLVARASGTRSVIEPAMGAAAALSAVVVLLSVTAPTAVVFALAVAPVAFCLACIGAWFGLSRD